MVEKLLRRRALPEEITALVELHGELAAEGGSTEDWLVLGCFTVASSLESLFY